MLFILDVQGFQFKDSGFICKEIAIINIKNGTVYHRYINQPLPLSWISFHARNQIEWTSRNIHGLYWNDNDSKNLPFESISYFIRDIVQDYPIFVNGLQKKDWLSKLIPNHIINLEHKENFNFKKLKQNVKETYVCKKHYGSITLRCARENVFILRNWCIKNKNNLWYEKI